MSDSVVRHKSKPDSGEDAARHLRWPAVTAPSHVDRRWGWRGASGNLLTRLKSFYPDTLFAWCASWVWDGLGDSDDKPLSYLAD